MYWIGGAGLPKDGADGTDFHATAQGRVSTITPLQVDLTEHARCPTGPDRVARFAVRRDDASPRLSGAARPRRLPTRRREQRQP
jgi:hypothetical protein